MAHNLTESSTFTANVPVPDDGDTANEASVEPAFQALANRTKYLGDRAAASSTDNVAVRFDGTSGKIQSSAVSIEDDGDVTGAKDVTISGDFKYASPGKTRTRLYNWFDGASDFGSWSFLTGWLLSGANPARWVIPLSDIPDGAVITGARVKMQPGASRTSTARPFISLTERVPDMSTTVDDGDRVSIDITYTGASTTAIHVTSTPTLSETVNKATRILELVLSSGTTAGSDRFLGVEVTYTDFGNNG